MVGNTAVMLLLILSTNPLHVVFLFFSYGMLDSLTQPLFSHTITTIEAKNRGKVLAGIDSIILFSPSIGMYVIGYLMDKNPYIGCAMLSFIFLIALFIICINKEFRTITLPKEKEVSNETLEI